MERWRPSIWQGNETSDSSRMTVPSASHSCAFLRSSERPPRRCRRTRDPGCPKSRGERSSTCATGSHTPTWTWTWPSSRQHCATTCPRSSSPYGKPSTLSMPDAEPACARSSGGEMEPGRGLEPRTPSLPWRSEPQLHAFGSRRSGLPLRISPTADCVRLPLFATAELQTCSMIFGRTERLPLRTYETVFRATPARSAICAIMAGLVSVICLDCLTACSATILTSAGRVC